MKKKPIIKFGCYICKKGVDSDKLATTKKGNIIQSESPKLKKGDNHFICKDCFVKATNFFDIEITDD